MIAKAFVDTNIFVYARDSAEKRKQTVARKLITDLKRKDALIISSQVITEFCSVMTYKLKAQIEKVTADVTRLLELEPVALDADVLRQGVLLRKQYNLSWWDSWIVGAAIVSGCTQIYSEDLATGASYHGVLVTNPFTKN